MLPPERGGCRDLGFIGHRAISLTSCWRALETIGWQHAEPVLRFVVRDLMGQDQYYPGNVTRVDRQLAQLPPGWVAGIANRGATLDLVGLLRQGKSAEACDLACKQLADGIGAQPIWDALHVSAAELMILHASASGMAGRPIHLNTAVNALHYAFVAGMSDRTRLLVLLQAVAWAGDFIRVQVGAKNLERTQLTELEGAALPATVEEAVAEIFSLLPPHTYQFDSRTKTGTGHLLVDPAARVEPMRKVFALLTKHPEAAPPLPPGRAELADPEGGDGGPRIQAPGGALRGLRARQSRVAVSPPGRLGPLAPRQTESRLAGDPAGAGRPPLGLETNKGRPQSREGGLAIAKANCRWRGSSWRRRQSHRA